jgi:hypothetical protein
MQRLIVVLEGGNIDHLQLESHELKADHLHRKRHSPHRTLQLTGPSDDILLMPTTTSNLPSWLQIIELNTTLIEAKGLFVVTSAKM